jgi:hypothetical protein
MPRRNSLLIGLFILLMVDLQPLSAQIRTSSPYSRYGLGDIMGSRLSRSLAIGGTAFAMRDNLMINIQNPASYTAFDSLSFLAEIGLSSNFNQLQTSTNIQKFNNLTSLGYITFGFPVTRWMGMSAGLVPYSQTGYKLIVNDSAAGVGNVTQKYEGYGNLNRFYLGSGFKLHRDLSIGFNASFLFGTLNHIRSAYFDDLTYVFHTRMTNSLIINDFHAEAGLQYHHMFKDDHYLNAGLTYQLPFDVRGRRTNVVERFVTSTTGLETTRDTVEYLRNQGGNINMPGGLGGGLVFGKKNYWMVGADVAWQNWGAFTSFGEKDSLTSSLKASAGMMIVPKHSSVSNYFRKITYRAGFRYEDTYLELKGHRISEYAVTAGFGFPFRKTGSSVNIALEVGQRGTTKDGLIKETFIRGVIGLSIKEFWFFRRKLD